MPPRRFDGQLLRTVRRAADMSQKDLASAIGLTSNAPVTQWEKGSAFPSAERLPAIASALGSPLDKLFPRDGAPDLADLRCDAGLSQLHAAERLTGVSRFQIGKAERGEKRLDDEALSQLAVLYGVTLEALKGAQARVFGDPATQPGPSAQDSFAGRIARYLSGRPDLSPQELVDSVNAWAGKETLRLAQLEALLAGEVLEEVVLEESSRTLVTEGLARACGMSVDEVLERRILDDIRLLADQHQIALSARGGEGGVSPEMIRVLNELLSAESREG